MVRHARVFRMAVLCGAALAICNTSFAKRVDFWDISMVDNGVDGISVGSTTGLTFLRYGKPAVSYYRSGLWYAVLENGIWQKTKVDSSVGQYNSLAHQPWRVLDQPAISYFNDFSGNLKYAWKDGGQWYTTNVDTLGWVGAYSSLAFTRMSPHTPCISYRDDFYNYDLKYAWFDGDTWHNVTVTDDSATFNSLAFNSRQPRISYYDESDEDLKFAWHDGNHWNFTTIDSVGDVGKYNSMAPGAFGCGVSYYDASNRDLKYAWNHGMFGSPWDIATVESAGDVGMYSSLANMVFGPSIAYYDASHGSLKWAWADSWHDWNRVTTVDTATIGRAGEQCSLIVLPNGRPAIVYHYGADSPLYENYHIRYATMVYVPVAVLPTSSSYTATATTELGGTTTASNAEALNTGNGYGEIPAYAVSWARFDKTDGGHFRGVIQLAGQDGEDCAWFDPEFGCIDWWPTSCRDANGTIAGTITIGLSDYFPPGRLMRFLLSVHLVGEPGDSTDYHLKLLRGTTLLAQIDPSSSQTATTNLFTGETVNFELFASQSDLYDDYIGYDYRFEYRIILVEPSNLDLEGPVNLIDYALFAEHWGDDTCEIPDSCGGADFNEDGKVDWLDLAYFASRYMQYDML